MTTVPLATTLDEAETATAVEAAVLLVALAIHDTTQPMEQLCDAVERMRQALPADVTRQTVATSARAIRELQMARNLAICVESMQFHDRLLQQLAFVRDLLAAALKHQPLDVAAYGAPRWEALTAAIRHHAPLDSRFELFDVLAPPGRSKMEGSCELFE
jgi:hypothetical protein